VTQAELKRCKVTKHLKSKNKQIFGDVFVAVQNDMLCSYFKIKIGVINMVDVGLNDCLPVEDIKAQDGVATERLPSAGVPGSIAY
jgi:hypothetical protein